MEGICAVVTGASGVVGSGIVRLFLIKGSSVIAPVRSEAGATKLRTALQGISLDNLETPIASPTDEEAITSLAARVKDKYGSVDYVVSSVGSWWQKGPLLQQSVQEMESCYRTYVLSHFIIAKAFIPLLAASPSSSYTFITGAAGEQCLMSDASMVTAQVAGLFGVINCIQAEYAEKPYPRINEARIGVAIRPHEEVAANPGTFSNRALGQVVLDLVVSDLKGRVVRIGPEQLQAVSF